MTISPVIEVPPTLPLGPLGMAALDLARRGFALLPLHSMSGHRCTCNNPDCHSPGKHPRTKDGHKAATSDAAIITQWWTDWPTANIGCVPGLSGYVVIDIDGPEGFATASTLGLLAEPTLEVETARGRHRWYIHPGGMIGNSPLGHGVDVRADMGYVVVPPSVHHTGHQYSWAGSFPDAVPFPPNVAAALRKPRRMAGPLTAAPPAHSTASPTALPGCRNTTLASLVGRLIREGGTYEDVLREAFRINATWPQPLEEGEVRGVVDNITATDSRRRLSASSKPPGEDGGVRVDVRRRGRAQWHVVVDGPGLAGPTVDVLDILSASKRAAFVQQLPEYVQGPVAQILTTRAAEVATTPSPEEATDESADSGRPGLFPPCEPWPESVSGIALLEDVHEVFCRHLVLPEGAAVALTLWVVFSHTHDAFANSPVLALQSPEKRCGKTTTLALVGALVPRGLRTSSITQATLYRLIEQYHPTLLIDEADTYLATHPELVGILNGGWLRGEVIPRCEGEGTKEIRVFSPWAPKAIAGIKRLPDTLQDRSIAVTLKRKRPGERRTRLNHVEVASTFQTVREQLARLGQDLFPLLASQHSVEVPSELHDRAADNWRPLLTIADAIGGRWPTAARDAARLLSNVDPADDSLGVLLLLDLRECFRQAGVDRVTTPELVAYLTGLEDRPWSAVGPRERHVTARDIARLLKPYGIEPMQWRGDGRGGIRGYVRAHCEEAFGRYLTVGMAATPLQTLSDNDLAQGREWNAAPANPLPVNDVAA